MATTIDPLFASTSTMASCEAPAKTIVDSPTADHPPKPSDTGATPATSPNGITPSSIGAAPAAPARNSDSDGITR